MRINDWEEKMTLKKYLKHYRNNKALIIKYWIEDEDVLLLLNKYKINKEVFIKKYALEILDNYLDGIEDIHKVGSCKPMNELLIYLKKEKITSNQLFIIFSGFKHALLKYADDLNIFTYTISKEINYIYERNFANVLKNYTKSILEVQAELKNTLDMVDKYIIISRTNLDGKILNASEAFCKISGFSLKELQDGTHNILKHPGTHDEIYKELWDTIQSGNIWQGEIQNINKEGEPYWVEATIKPYFDEKGQITYYEAIRQDITSKKEVELQHNILIEQSKSAAIGEMISMIAHQWRQPLQSVSLLTQKLPIVKMIEGEVSDKILNEVVDDVAIQIKYMSNTIDDFRDFFKPAKEKVEASVAEVVNRVMTFVSYSLKSKDISLQIEKKDDVKIALYDKEIIQVLINLINNAADILENIIIKRTIKISYTHNDSEVIIEVQDNAGGIKEDIMNRIFEPYFSTKSNKNGTGLGLYMSKMIVEQHSGGKLSAINANEGALFRIQLPLS